MVDSDVSFVMPSFLVIKDLVFCFSFLFLVGLNVIRV